MESIKEKFINILFATALYLLGTILIARAMVGVMLYGKPDSAGQIIYGVAIAIGIIAYFIGCAVLISIPIKDKDKKKRRRND